MQEGGKSETSFGVTRRVLRESIRGEAPALAASLTATLAALAAALLLPWPIKLVMDCVVGHETPPQFVQTILALFSSANPSEPAGKNALLALLCIAVVAIQLITSGLSVLATYLLSASSLRMVYTLRFRVFEHLHALALNRRGDKNTGDLIYRVTWDTYCIHSIVEKGLVPAVTAAITLGSVTAIMCSKDWLVTLAALSVAIPVILYITRLSRPMTSQSLRLHERESAVTSKVQESLRGRQTVRVFGRLASELVSFTRSANDSRSANLSLTLLECASAAVIELLLTAGTAAVACISARRVMQGDLTAGDVVLLMSYVAMLYRPLGALATTATTMQIAAASAKRVYEILDARAEVVDRGAQLPADPHVRSITLEHVCHEYESGQASLRDVNLTIGRGETIALVGDVAAGKSTLLSLLARMQDPTAGRILFNDADLRHIRLADLRRLVTIVPQEPVLLDISIRDNIRYAKPDATAGEVEMAARAAGIHEFIESLDAGYDAILGEDGLSLSPMQGHLVSFARAFLHDAPILLIDDLMVTAPREQRLLRLIQRLMENKTVVIVTHHVETAGQASRVVLLEAGGVGDVGTHVELMDRNAGYRELFKFDPPTARAA